MNLEANSDVTKLPLTIGVGGVQSTFNFNKSGSAANPPGSTAKLKIRRNRTGIPSQESQLTVMIEGTGFKSLISQGVATGTNRLPLKVVVVFAFNGEALSYVDTIAFKITKTSTTGRLGITTSKSFWPRHIASPAVHFCTKQHAS